MRNQGDSLTDLNFEQLIVTDGEVEVSRVILEEIQNHASHLSHKVDMH